MQKISIGVTTYNRNNLLKRAIRSILNQSYRNFEILIGNDYVKKKINKKILGTSDPRIKIFNYKKNLGEVENMNYLLKKSKSKWFTWLADDDFLNKNFLKDLYNSLNLHKNKKVVAVYSNYRRVTNNKFKKINVKADPILYNKENFIENYCSQKIRLIGVYGLINSKILKIIQKKKKLGKSILIDGKPSGVHAYTDTMLPIRLSEYGNIIWIDKKLVNLDLRYNAISKKTLDYKSYFSSQKDAFDILINIVEKIKIQKIQLKIYKSFFEKILFNKVDLLFRQKLLSKLNILLIFLIYSISVQKNLEFKKKLVLIRPIIKYLILILFTKR